MYLIKQLQILLNTKIEAIQEDIKELKTLNSRAVLVSLEEKLDKKNKQLLLLGAAQVLVFILALIALLK